MLDLGELETFVAERRPDVAVLTVPQSVAQSTADRLIGLGVRGILELYQRGAEQLLRRGVRFEDVHFADSLLTLSYRITQR